MGTAKKKALIMNLKPFKRALDFQNLKKDIFIHSLPEDSKEGILITHGLNGASLDPDLPGYKRAKFQVIVRALDYESGYELSKSIIDIYSAIKSEKVLSIFVYFIQPLHDPLAFPVSKGGFTEFSVTYETVYIER